MIVFFFRNEIKLDSQPQGVDINENGLVVVACINKILLVANKKISAFLPVSYETTSVSVSRRRRTIAVGGKDNKVHIYEFNESATSLSEAHTLAERDFITAVRYSHNDDYLAVADNAKNVKCYKLDEANVKSYADVTRDLWQHHAGKITSISWSPDSTHLATSSVDTHCLIYSPNKVNQSIQIKSNSYQYSTKKNFLNFIFHE